jgi:hypothetical protein
MKPVRLTLFAMPAAVTLSTLLPAVSPAQEPWTTDVHAELRGRYEDRNNRDFRSERDDARQDGLLRLRVDITSRNRAGTTLFFQPQVSFDDRAMPASDGTDTRTSLHQAWVQWKMPDTPDLTARVGRQELAYGNQRLIGAFNWDNVGRSFDAARADLKAGPHGLSLFAARLGDAPGRTQTPSLYGIYDTITWRAGRVTDVYALNKRDRVQGNTLDITTFGARADLAARGGWGLLAEGAVQRGRVSGKDQRAWAQSISVGKSFAGPLAPRLAVEYNAASGGNPDDPGTSHTFDQLFPTNHDKYGLMDYQGWRNMRHFQAGVTARLPRSVSVGLQHHWFRLHNARDFWYAANGTPNRGASGPLRSPGGTAGKSVGREWDVYASMPAGAGMNVSFGYARFMPGSFVKAVNATADASSWWYAQFAIRR